MKEGNNQIIIHNTDDNMKKYNLIQDKRPREMHGWQDCQWLRIPCGKADCPICSRLKKEGNTIIAHNDDEDGKEMLMEVSRSFKEMMELLEAQCKKMNIDIEEAKKTEVPKEKSPEEYPLYNKIMDWRQEIFDIAEESDEVSSAWLSSEAGEDLMWYMSTWQVKTYRQLSTINSIKEMNDGDNDPEYRYTGYVLSRVLDILDKSLTELANNGNAQAKKFKLAKLSFDVIRKDMIDSYL